MADRPGANATAVELRHMVREGPRDIPVLRPSRRTVPACRLLEASGEARRRRLHAVRAVRFEVVRRMRDRAVARSLRDARHHPKPTAVLDWLRDHDSLATARSTRCRDGRRTRSCPLRYWSPTRPGRPRPRRENRRAGAARRGDGSRLYGAAPDARDDRQRGDPRGRRRRRGQHPLRRAYDRLPADHGVVPRARGRRTSSSWAAA